MPELVVHAAANDDLWRESLDRLGRLRDADFPLALAAWLAGMMEADAAKRLGRRLRLSNKEIDRTAWLLENLPAMRRAAEIPWPQLQRRLAHDGGEDLLALAAAALPADDPGLERCCARVAESANPWNPPPLVAGNDLIAAGLPAGRHFAELLDHLRDEQLEGRLRTARRSACGSPPLDRRAAVAVDESRFEPYHRTRAVPPTFHCEPMMTPPPDADACQFFSAVLLAAGEPAIDGPTAVRIASRALHLLCGIILGGGVFYLRLGAGAGWARGVRRAAPGLGPLGRRRVDDSAGHRTLQLHHVHSRLESRRRHAAAEHVSYVLRHQVFVGHFGDVHRRARRRQVRGGRAHPDESVVVAEHRLDGGDGHHHSRRDDELVAHGVMGDDRREAAPDALAPLARRIPMDGKAKKRIEVIQKKLPGLQRQLAGAKAQPDDPQEPARIQAEIDKLQAELAKLKAS